MDFQKVPLTQSIGAELLKKIFGVYCIAAVIISLFQGWAEYVQTRDRVVLNLVEHQALTEDGLANAVWHLDQPLINSLIKGILSQSIITGVSIYNENGEVIAQSGRIEPDVAQTKQKSAHDYPSRSQNENTYRHHFKLFDPNGLSSDPIGLAVFYTGSDVVIEDVTPTWISLVVAAVIKTAILWAVFLYFGRKLLSHPLTNLISTVRKLPLDKTDESETQHKQGLNELELFECALTNMAQKLKRTLVDLRSSNEKLSNLNIHLQRAVEQSPTISTIFSHDGKMLYTTPSFTTLTGYTSDEAQALFDNYFFKEQPISSIVKQFENNPSQTDMWSGEVKVLHKDGSPMYLAASLTPVCDEGRVINFLCSSNDISALKQLELDLKQKNREQQKIISKLEEAHIQLHQSAKMASIGQLAAGIAHEINNPVGFINSNVVMLSKYVNDLFALINVYEKAAKDLPASLAGIQQFRQDIDFDFLREDIPNMMDDTQEGLSRVKKIVRDLMDFSRINETELITYDLRKGLESTLNVAWHELKYKAEVIKEFNEIPDIECMPSQLNQVFMSLMVNAAQAMDTQGTITLRTRSEENQVIVEVEDSGSGIEPEHLNRLFDPFFTTKPVGKGTGLGLSVAYGIVKKHNGRIEVDSSPGKGTCFRICLPIRQPVAA